MSCLPKPVLRGHVGRRGFKTIIAAVGFGVINGALYHYFSALPRKRAYEEFLKTYDGDAHTADLIAWGYLKGVHSMKEKMKEALEK